MIQVRALGTAEVQIGRNRITKRTELVLAVAVYLCMRAGERVSRNAIIDVFWPGGDPLKGRHSLRQMLYKLRLKGFALDVDAEELYLDPTGVDCDATAALAESWPEAAEPWMIENSGAFLSVVTREISPQFREWIDETRSRLAAQYRRAGLRQIVQARREGRWADLERWARVLLRTDPLNEEATLARAESAAMAGSKATALQIIDQYVEDLGERAGLIALPATVLRRRISERRTEWGGTGANEVALVGREGIMKQLTEAVEAAANRQGGAFVLRGAAGIGKTRVSDEARAFADLGGFRSMVIRIPPSAATQPLSVALTLIPQLLELRGAAGCPPLAMTILRSTTAPERTPSVGAPSTTSPDTLAWALGALLEVLSDDHRLLILLDDLHHCDAESLRLVTRLAASTRSLRLAWLATSRLSHSHVGTPFRHIPSFITINVLPLSPESSLSLARTYSLFHARSRSDAAVQRLASLSGGNPLFIRELSSDRDPPVVPSRPPARLRNLIRERLSELSLHEIFVLRVIGILGPHASIVRVRTLMRAEHTVLADALEQLSHSGIVTLGAAGTLELNESWQAAIIEQLTPAASAALGLQCAELLVVDGQAAHSLARTRRAAELFLDSGDLRRAALLFESAGDELRARQLRVHTADADEPSVTPSGSDFTGAPLLVTFASSRRTALDYGSTLSLCERALRGRSRRVNTDRRRPSHLEVLEVSSAWNPGRAYHPPLAEVAAAGRRSGLRAEARHFESLIGLHLNDGHPALDSRFSERRSPMAVAPLSVQRAQVDRRAR